MSTPSFNEWKKDNLGKGLNEYYEAYPETRLTANQGNPIIVNKSYQKESSTSFSIVWILLIVAIVGGSLIYGMRSCQNNQILEHKMQAEVRYPQQYLIVTESEAKVGLFRNASVTGWIENKSKYTIYADIVLVFQFLNEYQTVIREEKVSIDIRSGPGGHHMFETNVKFPRKSEEYKINVLGARVAGQHGVSISDPGVIYND